MKRKSGAVISIVLFSVLLGSLITTQESSIKRQLNDWKVLPQPERLTELYFTNQANLPTTFTAGQIQTVSFDVHNIEYRNFSYKYSITQSNINGTQTAKLAEGSFTLPQNQYEIVKRRVTLTDLGSQSKVIVLLSPVNESIEYLVGTGK